MTVSRETAAFGPMGTQPVEEMDVFNEGLENLQGLGNTGSFGGER